MRQIKLLKRLDAKIKDNIITLYIRKEDCRKNFDISKYDMRFREM